MYSFRKRIRKLVTIPSKVTEVADNREGRDTIVASKEKTLYNELSV